MNRVATLMLGLVLACLAPAGNAAAEKEIVYWPLVSNATEYRRVSYPRQAGPLIVLAGTEVVVEARHAEVMFWPITREYLADVAGEPDPVDGTIEIVDNAGTISTPEPEPFVLWYPDGVGAGPSDLVRGDDAVKLYKDYVAKARANAEEMLAYQRLVAEAEAEVAAWARAAAEDPENLPPPPPELTAVEPEPFQTYVSEPREAAIVALPAGSYTVRIRKPNGQIAADSERQIISFSALDEGVGYILRPEDRWTRPLFTFDPDEMVYTTGKTDLFFQPVPVVEYPARQFTRLFRPQSVQVTDPSLTLWAPKKVQGEENSPSPFVLWSGSARLETLEPSPYRVVQKLGLSRGYLIEDFTGRELASIKPDFTAIRVARDLAVTALGPDSAAGAGMREIRRVTLVPEYLLFLPGLLPVAFWLGLRCKAGAVRANGMHKNQGRVE